MNILFLFLVLGFAAAEISSTNGQEKWHNHTVSVDTILRALGAPSCMRTCIDPFMESLTALWDMEQIVEHTEKICSAHAEAAACMKKDVLCDSQNLFATASSSISHRCEKQSKMFDRLEKCMQGKTDNIMQRCDSSCGLRSNVTAFSQHPSIQMAAKLGGNVFIVSDHLGDLCGSLSCIIPCVTRELNAVCPLSGWLTLDVILQPLEAISNLVDGLAPSLKDVIMKKLDKRCHFAIDTVRLIQLRKGQFYALYQ